MVDGAGSSWGTMGSMSLDLDFLAKIPILPSTPQQAVNVFDILREGSLETRVDMTLKFFLDPNERHGLGPLVLDSLLALVDGATVFRRDGSTAILRSQDFMGSDGWSVQTQSEFIDVFAVNTELDIALVIENKIGHVLNNPLGKYVRTALRDAGRVIVIVLAPSSRAHVSQDQQLWISQSVPYSDLISEIKSSPQLVEHLLRPIDLDQRRSLDFLQQFMEVRTGRDLMASLKEEDRFLSDWRAMLEDRGAAIEAFLNARKRLTALLKDRMRRLEPLVIQSLSENFEVESGPVGGTPEEVWAIFYLPALDWTFELKFSAHPAAPLVFAFDRQGRKYVNKRSTPLDVAWDQSDSDFVSAFVAAVTARVEEISASRPVTD